TGYDIIRGAAVALIDPIYAVVFLMEAWRAASPPNFILSVLGKHILDICCGAARLRRAAPQPRFSRGRPGALWAPSPALHRAACICLGQNFILSYWLRRLCRRSQ